MAKRLPERSYLEECFSLTDDGVLTWKTRPLHHFSSLHDMNVWNTRFSGKRAGHINKPERCMIVGVDGTTYRSHRICFFLFYGYVPDQIDHVDRDSFNNAKDNLRTANHSENAGNRVLPCNNKSGVKGVYWNKRVNKWHAQTRVRGRHIFLGFFTNLADAAAAYKAAAIKHFGEFANPICT